MIRHFPAILYVWAANLLIEPLALSTNLQNIAPDDRKQDHGYRQVVALIQDRPQLQQIVYVDNSIWKWLEAAFNYSNGGTKIYWDPGPTTKTNTFGAETEYLQSSGICFVRVDPADKAGQFVGLDKSAELILEELVLELNNAQHVNQAQELWRMVMDAKISRNDFILAKARGEFESELRVKTFWEHVWIPFCKEKHIKSDSEIWLMCDQDTFDDWIKLYPADSNYPWKVYGDQYDMLIKSTPKQ